MDKEIKQATFECERGGTCEFVKASRHKGYKCRKCDYLLNWLEDKNNGV